jgi:hypothetical protein
MNIGHGCEVTKDQAQFPILLKRNTSTLDGLILVIGWVREIPAGKERKE